jgi:ATP-dependent helicase/nuclease subunit A
MSQVLIPKPVGSQWTDDQWKAIVSSGKDILVAAAAGSGKTAVLVERIIKKITAKEHPVDVDRLLIVTFTNASAAEMRNRIGEALEKALKENPGSLHLRRQISLLNRASISTLHSFCLDVIRKYYYLIDIDPGFRIADDTEAALLREEVFEQLLEDYYSDPNNEHFFQLVDSYTSDRSDSEIVDMIWKLYEFSRSHPNPDGWLEQVVKMYEIDDSTEIEDLPFTSYLKADITLQLEGAKKILQQALKLTKLPGGPAPRAANIEDDLLQIERLLLANKQSWQTLYEQMQSLSFSRLKPCKGDDYDQHLIDQVTKLRTKAKELVEKLKEELFSRRPESLLKDLKQMKPVVSTLVELVKDFDRRYQQLKLEKGLVDFSDLEHYCLQILRDPSSAADENKPSEAALDYRAQFEEVLVDEYQDTNMVQEAILQLVTKEGEATGNLFMVGDVKQSIYRFRLAEPLLFLNKYKRFTREGNNSGLRIDLSKNFRSRSEVLDATNFLFKQIMGETVGEIDYDEDAELKLGAEYPDSPDMTPEVILINKTGGENSSSNQEEETAEFAAAFDPVELETAQLEARAMAKKIKQLIQGKFQIYDRKIGTTRNITYRDIVILLRSMPWAPQIMEEFKQQGIPIYAELNTGYFEATEVSIMLSLLKVIDNPFQDIPLASVLRSPIVGLSSDELAKLRIHSKEGAYYEAMASFLHAKPAGEEQLWNKVKRFYDRLQEWRTIARQGALSDLIWRLYRETRFYDFVGGMPGGKQRQANLRALYDRARQYESTSFRGLFRFLRFIERMQDRGDDLGTARALGEQEDVVRMMTIHSSKGLEFPVVFVAGLAKSFNMRDLYRKYLLDKDLGFASRYVDPKLRISYPTLPQLTIKRKMKLELIAEEMRILYVALTRAKEKLYLIGTLKEAEKMFEAWREHLSHTEWLLPDFDRVQAKSYIDWIGPALVRHHDCELLHGDASISHVPSDIAQHPSKWTVEMINDFELQEDAIKEENHHQERLEAIQKGEKIPIVTGFEDKVRDMLTWNYPHSLAASHRAKQSVSEIKRQLPGWIDTNDGALTHFRTPIAERPRFMQQKSLTAAEKGTALHLVMQHIDLQKPFTQESIKEQIIAMVNNELLTIEQAQTVDVNRIVTFFESEIGCRMAKAKIVRREVPFSFALPASDVYSDWQESEQEHIFVQGVIDLLFEDQEGMVLVDFKTDTIEGKFPGGFQQAKPVLEKRYKVQIELYSKAIERILRKSLEARYLYFFDGGHFIKL